MSYSSNKDVEKVLDMCIQKEDFIAGFKIALEMFQNGEFIKKVVEASIEKDAFKQIVKWVKISETQEMKYSSFSAILEAFYETENFQRVLSEFTEKEFLPYLLEFYRSKGAFRAATEVAQKINDNKDSHSRS